MINDLERKSQIPSLAEVLSALKKVHRPETTTNQTLRVEVEAADADTPTEIGDIPSRILNTPVVELRKLRYVDPRGERREAWVIEQMPPFHL